jgi:hypothetical protein
MTVINDSDEVAVPPAALLLREDHGLVDLESGVEQYEAALLVVDALPGESPVVHDGLAVAITACADAAVADDGHGGWHTPMMSSGLWAAGEVTCRPAL